MELKYLIIASRCVEFCFSLVLFLGFGLLQSLTLHLALDAPVSCRLCSAAKYRAVRAQNLLELCHILATSLAGNCSAVVLAYSFTAVCALAAGIVFTNFLIWSFWGHRNTSGSSRNLVNYNPSQQRKAGFCPVFPKIFYLFIFIRAVGFLNTSIISEMLWELVLLIWHSCFLICCFIMISLQ